MVTQRAQYWDAVARTWQGAPQQALWRAHYDQVTAALFAQWLPPGRVGRVLKTDVFEEILGNGLYPLLASRAEYVVGIDVSPVALRAARSRHDGLGALWADVRRLPFGDGAFDVVVSTSTLDHFDSLDDLVTGLRELCRVLRVGGQLLLTLDNLANPAVALRNALPFPLLHRIGILPYYVGATYRPGPLRRTLAGLGFDVAEITAVMHSPRMLAVAAAGLLERRAQPCIQRRFLRWLMASERLGRLPTRFLTGYFIAVKAVRRAGSA